MPLVLVKPPEKSRWGSVLLSGLDALVIHKAGTKRGGMVEPTPGIIRGQLDPRAPPALLGAPPMLLDTIYSAIRCD